MEVSMETSPQAHAAPAPPAPPAPPQQAAPAAPTPTPTPAPQQTDLGTTDLGTPRKRSLSALDTGSENQENSDPNAGDGNDPAHGHGHGHGNGNGNGNGNGTGNTSESTSPIRVEVPLCSIAPPNKSVEQVDGDGDVIATADGPGNGSGNANGDKDMNGTGDGGDAGSTTPAAKKRKVSPASKEIKQQEKEARERQKAEEKTRKDEEKAKREEEKKAREEEKKAREEEKKAKEEEKKKREAEREEEKKKREAEREEKKRVKDEERAAKEEERKKKEEEKSKREQEKTKKERAQMRLNAFFVKPKGETAGPGASPSKSASGDTTTNDDAGDVVSDYYRVFPEFFLQSHTSVAPPHRFQRDSEALAMMRQRVDQSLKASKEGGAEPPVFRPSELFRLMPYQRRWGRQAASVKDLLLQIQNMGGSGDAVGTTEVKTSSRRPQELLSKVRMKSLKFGEDVRPPYQGTFTRKVPKSSAQKIARNPFRRCLPETNYDYDSEAEWEEPEEGEELDSEEEEEAEDDMDDDMDGFLDDEDEDEPVDGKRRLIVGDLEPQTSGLRWQTTSTTVDPALQMYKIETISDTVTFPIDPFSTVYWQKPKATDAGGSGTGSGTTDRSTLCARGHNASADGNQHPGSGLALLGGTGKTKRGFPPEQLADFQEVVNGSDLTKMGLVEILKKRYPKTC